MKNKQNEGVRTYQEERRKETIAKISEAYNYLKETNQTITKAALSRESGVSRVTLNKAEIVEFLAGYPEFSEEKAESNPNISVLELQTSLQIAKAELSRSRNRNNRIAAENLRLRKEVEELEQKYQKLLGDYQKMAEGKTIRL